MISDHLDATLNHSNEYQFFVSAEINGCQIGWKLLPKSINNRGDYVVLSSQGKCNGF